MRSPSERLSAQDLKDVLHIGRVAFECKDTDQMATEVLRLLEPVFKTGCSNFFFSRASANELDLDRVISITIQEKSFALFRRYYHELDPFIDVLSSQLRPTVLTTDQLVSYKDLVAGDYYNEFLKPQSIYSQMSVFLWSEMRLLGSFNLFRPRNAPVFSPRERAKAELAAPYLAEALNKILISTTMKEQELVMNTILQSLPFTAIVLMDESFEPVYCNKTAIKILSGLYNDDDCVKRLSETLRLQLKGLLLHEISNEAASVSRAMVHLGTDEDGRKTWASIIPLPDKGRLLFAVCLNSKNKGREMRGSPCVF